jgi:FkbM family methyltransferase
MNLIEALCVKVRHSAILSKMGWLWAILRPAYNRLVNLIGRGGIERCFNGTDRMLIVPELRGIGEVYEPEVWPLVMSALKPGSRVLDAGSHVGYYAIPLALRVGSKGRVFAAEPDPRNLAFLSRHATLNGVTDQMQIIPAALSDVEGQMVLHTQEYQSQLRPGNDGDGLRVRVTTVDAVVGSGERLDVMLIDVEGFELPVLKGASNLLRDPARRPQTIVIEVHPYAWELANTTSELFLAFLNSKGYYVTDLKSQAVTHITEYGHVVARIAN